MTDQHTSDLPSAPAPGNVYEDFMVGNLYRHSLGRTITTTDNSWFTQLTLNTNPIHFDHAYAAKTEWGRPLVNSTFVLALVTGLSVEDLSKNGVNLGWDNVRLPHPVFEGDTIYAQSEVLSRRNSKSRPHQGIVRFRTQGFNQDSVIVISYERSVLIYRRAHVPARPTLPGPRQP